MRSSITICFCLALASSVALAAPILTPRQDPDTTTANSYQDGAGPGAGSEHVPAGIKARESFVDLVNELGERSITSRSPAYFRMGAGREEHDHDRQPAQNQNQTTTVVVGQNPGSGPYSPTPAQNLATSSGAYGGSYGGPSASGAYGGSYTDPASAAAYAKRDNDQPGGDSGPQEPVTQMLARMQAAKRAHEEDHPIARDVQDGLVRLLSRLSSRTNNILGRDIT